MDSAVLARENALLKARLTEVEAALAELQEANRRLEDILRTSQREKFGKPRRIGQRHRAYITAAPSVNATERIIEVRAETPAALAFKTWTLDEVSGQLPTLVLAAAKVRSAASQTST